MCNNIMMAQKHLTSSWHSSILLFRTNTIYCLLISISIIPCRRCRCFLVSYELLTIGNFMMIAPRLMLDAFEAHDACAIIFGVVFVWKGFITDAFGACSFLAGVADHLVGENARVDFRRLDMLTDNDFLFEIKVQAVNDIVWHLINKVTHRCCVSWGSRRTADTDLYLRRVILSLKIVMIRCTIDSIVILAC